LPTQWHQLHNAAHFERVTVYYRWHPFFGLSLPIRKRKKDFSGEQIFCHLPDDVICSFPAWMFSPECTQRKRQANPPFFPATSVMK
jgi:hypothetical protein